MSLSRHTLPTSCLDYYQLLKVAPFEGDLKVIESQARSLMREARKYQVGQFSADAETCMNLLAEARACLLDPERKRQYDDELRNKWGLPLVSVAACEPPDEATILANAPVGRAAGFRRADAALAGVALVLAMAFYFRHDQATTPPHWADDDTIDVRPAVVSVPPPALQPGDAARRPPVPPATAPAKQVADAEVIVAQANAKPAAAPAAMQLPPAPVTMAAERPSMEPSAAPAPPGPAAGRELPPEAEMLKNAAPGDVANPQAAARNVARERGADAADDLHLSATRVISEIKKLRGQYIRMYPAMRSQAKVSYSVRFLKLIRYGNEHYGDDLRFQKQLQVELETLQRAAPELRNVWQETLNERN